MSQRNNKRIDKWRGRLDPGIKMRLHGQKNGESKRKRRKPNLRTLRAWLNIHFSALTHVHSKHINRCDIRKSRNPSIKVTLANVGEAHR